MDGNGNAACMPFSTAGQPVLGVDDKCSLAMAGYEKAESCVRRTRFAVQFTQGGVAGADFAAAAITDRNLLARGVGDVVTDNGYPAAFNGDVLSRAETNLYAGGFPVQPGDAWLVRGIGVTALPVFRLPGAVRVYDSALKNVQAEIQQMVLANAHLTFRPRIGSACEIELDTLIYHPSPLSSGMPQDSSQNGEPLKGNAARLPLGFPIGTDATERSNFQLLLDMPALTRSFDAAVPLPVNPTIIIAEFEVTMWGEPIPSARACEAIKRCAELLRK